LRHFYLESFDIFLNKLKKYCRLVLRLNSDISKNVFSTTGIIRSTVLTSWTNTVNQNNFNGTGDLKVKIHPGGGILNAENNWWGDLSVYG